MENQGAQRTRSEMSVHSGIELEFENLVCEERRNLEYPEKSLLEQSREPTLIFRPDSLINRHVLK